MQFYPLTFLDFSYVSIAFNTIVSIVWYNVFDNIFEMFLYILYLAFVFFQALTVFIIVKFWIEGKYN